ncbi:ABC transporter domain-containing protein [Ditylenchus destructor]|nr:ABC transporter domain-containing protein [Ditylenchus destructor]
MAITVSNYLGEKLPTMPEEVRNYVTDLLRENLEEMTSVDEVYDAVGDHIQSSVDGLSNDDVQDICLKLMNILHDGKKVVSVNRETAARKLDQTVDMSVQSDSYKKVDSIWKVSAKDCPTMNVDKNKLNRAEARSKDKALKRAEEQSTQGNSKPSVVKKRPQILATASQAPNRREGKEIGSLDIKIEGIDISFGTKQLVSSADLNLVFGHRYGLVGRNGIGKTTLLKMLSTGQLVIPSNITMLSVEQEVEGDDTLVVDSVLACDTKRASLLDEEKRLQATMNDGSLSDEERSSVTTRLNEVYMEMEAAQVDKAPARAAHILFGLGFSPEEQKRPTREFSGGWRMRVALARALFMKPDLLLLDEPTNMLDMRAVYWLESYLQEWPSTILTVSHDRKFLNTICTDIVHLHSRRLDAYKGNYENYEKAMSEKLTLQQREFEAQQQLRQHVQEFIDKFRYNAKRASMVQSRIKMLERMPVLQSVEFESDVVFHFRECEKLANSVLQLDEASFRYSKDSPLIFQNICCGSQSDSRICIVGENGSGKTTLLKVLLGELNPTTGVRNAHRRLNIGYFTQHHVDQLDMEMSGLELIAQKFPNLTQEEYRSSLARFGLTGDIVFQSIVTLSGGQKSRLAFACLSLQQPNYLILDEPTNHLDVETVDALGKALNHFKGGVILVSHDERLIELVCKELWVVKDKSVTTLEGGLEEYKKHVYRQLAIQM